METSSMWNMFDKIVCLHFIPWDDERFEATKKELKRVGILDLPQFDWELTVPNKFFEYIKIPAGKIQRGHGTVTKKTLQQTLHQYTLFKKLQLQGYQRVLFLEDDIAFHKDLDFIKSILEQTPEDWDVANFDPFRRRGWLGAGKGYWGHYYDLKGNEVPYDWNGETFLRYNSVVYNTDCVGLTGKAIAQIVERQENNLCPGDWYTWRETGDLNTYCVSKGNNICVQNKTFDTKVSDEYSSTFAQVYKGLDLTKYNITWREGYTKEVKPEGLELLPDLEEQDPIPGQI